MGRPGRIEHGLVMGTGGRPSRYVTNWGYGSGRGPSESASVLETGAVAPGSSSAARATAAALRRCWAAIFGSTACTEELARSAMLSVWEVGGIRRGGAGTIAQPRRACRRESGRWCRWTAGRAARHRRRPTGCQRGAGGARRRGAVVGVAPLLLAGGNAGGLVGGQAATACTSCRCRRGQGWLRPTFGHGRFHVSLLKLFDAATFLSRTSSASTPSLPRPRGRARCRRWRQGVFAQGELFPQATGWTGGLARRATVCERATAAPSRGAGAARRRRRYDFLARRVYLGAVVVLASGAATRG